jgi:hypothetical protein
MVALAALTAAAPASLAASKKAAAGAGAPGRTGRMATPMASLVKAVRKNDRAALERLAARLGPARLEEALAGNDAAVAEAALAAIPLLRARVLLTSAVAARLEAPDAKLAAAAARALGELFDGTAPTALDEWEVPPDVIARACERLRALASRLEAPVPARLAALDALASAREVCTASAELTPLLRDPVPAVRRAAALTLQPRERMVAAAMKDAIHDPDPKVASAAVASVCRAQAQIGAAKPDALVGESTAAARTLVAVKATPPEDAVEMLACVAAAHTPADRALLDQLRAGPPSPLRDRAAELLEEGARVRPE